MATKNATKRNVSKRSVKVSLGRKRARKVAPYAATAKSERASKIGYAVNLLADSKTGFTRDELSARTEMSRRLSAWDFNHLANEFGYEVKTGTKTVDGKTKTTYRFV